MFCDGCGAANRDGARFCRACGAGLAAGRDAGVDAALGDAPTVPVRAGAAPPVDAALAAVRAALASEFRVERPLGAGGMGAVYLAHEIALDRPVAIKVLRADLAASGPGVERFQREARVAARLRHPHIVAIHSVGERRGLHFFSMDFIDGATLADHVRAVGPGPALTLALGRPIALALAHAHRQGIVHRDLKPANVMVDAGGHVFVLDFGLARATTDPGLTASGAVIGTPRYMSPEQLEGLPATPRSDLYALGLVLHFLLTGDTPGRADSLLAIAAAHVQGTFAAAIDRDPRVPATLAPLLHGLLATDPAARPQSAQAVLEQLDLAAPSVAAAVASRDAISSASTLAAATPRATSAEAAEAAGAEPSPTPRPSSSPAPFRQKARARMKEILDRLEGDGKPGKHSS